MNKQKIFDWGKSKQQDAIINTLQEYFKEDNYVQVTIKNVILFGRQNMRDKVYAAFGGYEIKFQWLNWNTCAITIGEPIRTSAKGTIMEEKTSPTSNTVMEHFTRNHFGDVKKCPVCLEVKPIEAFAIRKDSKTGRRNSYCAPCSVIYKRWRRHYLREHNVKKLSDMGFKSNHTNAAFQEWYWNSRADADRAAHKEGK